MRESFRDVFDSIMRLLHRPLGCLVSPFFPWYIILQASGPSGPFQLALLFKVAFEIAVWEGLPWTSP